MSIFKKNPPSFGYSVQSGARRISSNIGNLVFGTVLASFILCGGAKYAAAQQANVLVNPGAENGLTGWKQSLTGYIYTVTTNGVSLGQTNLAHSGAATFQLFDTTADQAYIYQDFPCTPGSQWIGTTYALSYASNYMEGGESAALQVSFYDATNNLLTASNAANTTLGNAFGSDFLDTAQGELSNGINTNVFNWEYAPPMAVDSNGWVQLSATNIYDSDPIGEATIDYNYNPTNVLYAPPGAAKVRYMLLFTNASTAGGDAYFDDCVLQEVVGTDPDITSQSGDVTVTANGAATFSVSAVKALRGDILTYQWQKNGISLPVLGGVDEINLSTTNTSLQFTNVEADAAGSYDVVVSDIPSPGHTNSIRSVPVTLTVLNESPLQKVNALGPNGGFEANPVWLPWNIFNGCNFATTNSFYDAPLGTSNAPVNVYDGNTCCVIGNNGDRDNGFYQKVLASPGTTWKAGGWAYISSSNVFGGGNTERIQCWFNDSGGNSLTAEGTPTFESYKIYGLAYTNSDAQYTNIDTGDPSTYLQFTNHTTGLPSNDHWYYLPVTNQVTDGGVALWSDLPWTNFANGDFTVPTNANIAQINFQVYELCGVASDVANNGLQSDLLGLAADSVFWDDMELIPVNPPTNFTARVSGNSVNLSFAGQAGLDFDILYKTNLTDPTWSVLTNNVIAPISWQTNVNYYLLPSNNVGTYYYPITVSDSISSAHSRFYKVQAH
jgi:hypothetical protein